MICRLRFVTSSLLLLCVSMVCLLATATEIRTLSVSDIHQGALTSSAATGIPDFWVVRFLKDSSGALHGSGNEKLDQAVGTVYRKAFAEVAQRLAHVATFAEFSLDTDEAIAVAKSLKVDVTQLPAVYVFGSRLRRPTVRAGGMQYGRIVFPLPQGGITGADTGEVEKLYKMIRSNCPSRYSDPVTFQTIDTPTFVFSRKDMHQVSAQRVSQRESGAVTTLPSKAVLVHLRLTEPGDEDVIAAVAAVAAQVGPHVEVFVTEDADFAALFGLRSFRGAVVLPFPLPTDLSYVPSDVIQATLPDGSSLNDIALFLRTTAASSSSTNKARYSAAVASLRHDVHRLATSSPLRRLDSTDNFLRDIASPKAAVTVLYFLRETDEHFERDHKSAVEVAASFQTDPLQIAQLRTEVFYIDPEVHKDVPRMFNVPSVPAVAVLLGIQDGQHGVKFIGKDGIAVGSQQQGGGRAGQPSAASSGIPSTQTMLSYLRDQSKLMDTRGMFPLKSETVVLAKLSEQQRHDKELAKAAKQRRDRTRAMLDRASRRDDGNNAGSGGGLYDDDDAYTATVDNRRSLVTDLRTYPETEPQENTFVRQVAAGTFQFEAKKPSDDDAAASSTTKKTTKLTAKQQKKADAAKQKIAEELEAKKKAKEERMKQKALEDEAFREKMAAKTKQRATEQAKASTTSSAGGHPGAEHPLNSVPPTSNPNVVHADRPKYSSSKAPKNRHAQANDWVEDKKRMVKDRVKSGKNGNVKFANVLEL